MKKSSSNDHEPSATSESGASRAGKRARTDALVQRKRSSQSGDAPPALGSRAPAVATPSSDESFLESIIGPVQRREASEGTAQDVHEAASAGISGDARELPHLDKIQASFGTHDVSSVKAHSDERASAAASSMGASAFATGDHVVFAGTPDLHTAAHEAAHVVQQRAGVHLKGGVGQEGDAYERHADAVADAVVRGESAQSMLDQSVRASSSSTDSPPIQRQAAPAEGTVTRAELNEVVAKMNLINAYSMQMDFVFASMKAGIEDTCGRLEKRKTPRNDMMSRMVEIAASAAVAGVAGVVAEAAAKRLAGGLSRALSSPGTQLNEITIYLQSSQRFMNDGFKEIIKKSFGCGSIATA